LGPRAPAAGVTGSSPSRSPLTTRSRQGMASARPPEPRQATSPRTGIPSRWPGPSESCARPAKPDGARNSCATICAPKSAMIGRMWAAAAAATRRSRDTTTICDSRAASSVRSRASACTLWASSRLRILMATPHAWELTSQCPSPRRPRSWARSTPISPTSRAISKAFRPPSSCVRSTRSATSSPKERASITI